MGELVMITNENIKESGFSMLEMLIAMTILAIGLLGVAALQLTAINGSSYSMRYNQATVHISDKFEQLKNASSSADIKSGEETIGGYTIKTTVTPGPATGVSDVLIEATWKDTIGVKNHRIAYQTFIGPKQIGSSNP